ncbi:MAG: 4-hydroxy-tetrahydrodipicolinate reductase [Fimbriimonadales bacterium]
MRITLIGYGRMGQAVERIATGRGHTVLGAIRHTTPTAERFALAREADVLIDFSHADAVPETVALALQTNRPLVIGTTGWDDQRESIAQQVRQAGGSVLYAPNFSIAVQRFIHYAVALASELLRLEGWDVAMEEIHHRGKADAPSGTARKLADHLIAHLQTSHEWVAAPPAQGRLPQEQFVVSAIRLGTEFGTHRLMLDGPYDWIELTHRAKSREGFAYGAVRSAEWLPQHPGFWSFEQVLERVLQS